MEQRALKAMMNKSLLQKEIWCESFAHIYNKDSIILAIIFPEAENLTTNAVPVSENNWFLMSIHNLSL